MCSIGQAVGKDIVVTVVTFYISFTSVWLNNVRGLLDSKRWKSINKPACLASMCVTVLHLTWDGNLHAQPGVVFPTQSMGAGADKLLWPLQSHLMWDFQTDSHATERAIACNEHWLLSFYIFHNSDQKSIPVDCRITSSTDFIISLYSQFFRTFNCVAFDWLLAQFFFQTVVSPFNSSFVSVFHYV